MSGTFVETAIGNMEGYPVVRAGVKADCQFVSDGILAINTKILTSATGLFKPSDAGKTVLVQGAGTGGDDLRTFIVSVQSATQVTLNDAAVTGVNGVGTYWGTDNKAAIDAAILAVTPTSIGGRQVGGNTLLYPPGSILTSGGHVIPFNVEHEGCGAQATNIVHTGNNTCFTQTGSTLVSYGKYGFRKFSLWGNAGASAVGIEIQGKQWGPYLDHVMVGNYSNGIGLLLNNVTAAGFIEGLNLNDVTLRYNLIGVELRRTLGNESFAYQRWLNFDIHVPASGIGIQIGDGVKSTAQCLVYSGVFVGNIWLEGNNAVAVSIGQFGAVESNTRWFVKGERLSVSYTGTKSLAIAAGGIFIPKGEHDFAVGSGTTFIPAMDVANATTFKSPVRRSEKLQGQGFVAESFSREVCQGTSAPSVGVIIGTSVEFLRGQVVTGIALGISANGTGITLAKVGITDTPGTLLVSSADASATFNAGSLPRIQGTALTSPWTVLNDGDYFLCFLFVSGTAPTLIRGVNLAAAVSVAFGSNALITCQSAGGKTDLATFTPVGSGVSYWAAAY